MKSIEYLKMVSLFLFPLLISLQAAATGGSTVGNGGDFVQCLDSQNEPKYIYKSLDYLLTLDDNGDSDLIESKSLNGTLTEVQKVIDRNFPELTFSFREFLRTLWNSDVQESRIWEPAAFGVLPIGDEEIGSGHLIPLSCRQKSGETYSVNLVQAIVRLRERFNPDQPKRVYAYMSDLIKSVQKSDPVQVSFLLVHEWLWDYSKNVERNRRINRLLHSRSFHQLNVQEARSMLSGLGFLFPDEENQMFDGNYCQSSRSSMNELLTAKAGAILGAYTMKQRYRYCDSQTGCSGYSESEHSGHQDLFNGYVRLNQQASQIEILTEQSTPRTKNTLCSFSQEGQVDCSALLAKEGIYYFNGKPVSFSGNISSDCIHLKARIHYQQMSGNWTETEFVLLSRFNL
jgi:hypothetical protein